MVCHLKTDLRALKPLHFICIYLSLLPNFNEDLDATSSGYFYPCLMILINAGSWAFSTFGKTTRLAKVIVLSVRITELSSDLAITTANIFAIVCLCICRRKKVYKFLKDFKKLDEVCKPFASFIKSSEYRFISELVVVHVYFFIYYGYSSYTWVNSVSFDVFKYFISRDLQFYQLLMFSMLLRYYAFSIKYRFEILNGILAKVDQRQLYGESVAFVGSKALESGCDVKWVRSAYNALCGLLDQYNEIFGWHYVTIYINILINILGPVNTAIVYGTGWSSLEGSTMGWNLILLCLIWTGLPLIMGSAIFSACDEAEKEANAIPKTCYAVIEGLTDNGKDSVLKSELGDFAQHATNRKPEFSAAGFFTVNYNIVFNLMGSISSYLIVLIQFNAT